MENEIIILNEEKLNKVVESFQLFLDVDMITLKAYKVGIKSFISYLKENDIKNPTRLDFRGYRDTLKEIKSSNTINSYLTSIRAFFRYLELSGIYEDITKNVKNLKTSNIPKHQVFTEDKIKEIYNSIDDKRSRAIFSLAFTTGLRANEIANAKIENIKEYNGEIVLFVKCKKRDDESEYVKLSKLVLDNINAYIEHRNSGYIFISNSNNNMGNGMTSKSIRCIIKDIYKKVGIEENGVSCHTLRRTFATISYNNGADIVEIQQVLHQKSIQTTKLYISQCARDNNKLENKISDLILGG